jgi:hypothetical protein
MGTFTLSAERRGSGVRYSASTLNVYSGIAVLADHRARPSSEPVERKLYGKCGSMSASTERSSPADAPSKSSLTSMGCAARAAAAVRSRP